MVGELTLYETVIDIAEDYFGPAAPRFVGRLINNHLHKAPEQITTKDLPELVTWSKLTVAMLTDDKDAIEEFSSRLDALVKQNSRRK